MCLVLGSWNTLVRKAKVPALVEFTVCREGQMVNNKQEIYKFLKHKETEGKEG